MAPYPGDDRDRLFIAAGRSRNVLFQHAGSSEAHDSTQRTARFCIQPDRPDGMDRYRRRDAIWNSRRRRFDLLGYPQPRLTLLAREADVSGDRPHRARSTVRRA